MEKALEMGQTSASGSFQLFIGKLLSTIVLAVGTIVIGWYILQSDYGLYTIALIPATTILLFQDWGVNSALTRFCAQNRVTNNGTSLRKTITVALSFGLLTGIVLTVSLLLMSNIIASSVFGKPDSGFLIALASVSVLSISLSGVVQSVLIGFERMDLSSYVIIFQAVVQGVTAPLLVFLGYGAFGAVIGYTLGTIATSVISAFILYSKVFSKLGRLSSSKSFRETLKPLLHFGFPVAVSNILKGIQSQFYSFMMAAFCTTILIGNYTIANNFSLLIALFTYPLTTVLFPAFSKLDPQKEKILLRTVFSSSVKYSGLIVVPFVMAIMVLSQPLIGTLYGNKWVYSSDFLTIGSFGNLFILLGTLSVPSILYALGETKLLFKMNLISLITGIPLGLFLIPTFGIIGLIVSSIVAAMPYLFYGLYFLRKHYDANVDIRSSAKIFLACTTATLIVYFSLSIIVVPYWLSLAFGSILFAITFLVSAPLFGAISLTDIKTLRTMFSSLRVVSTLLDGPLKIMETLLKLKTLISSKEKSH